MHLLTLIYLSYGLPSLICYALVMFAMARLHKTLATCFRSIFMVTAFFNITTYINTWLAIRLRSEPFFFFYCEWMNGVEWIRQAKFVNIQQIGIGHLYLAQNLCALLLTLDRFIAIFSLFADLEIKKIWTKFFWIIVIVAHFLLVGLSVWTRLPMHTLYVLDVSGEFFFTERDPSQNPNVALNCLVTAIFGACVLVICSLLNIASLYQLYRLRTNRTTKAYPLTVKFNVDIDQIFEIWIVRHENALFVLSLSVFLAQSLSFVFVMIINLSNFYPDQMQINEMLMMFISDIFTLSPAFYTLFVRDPIRSKVALLFKKTLIYSNFTSSAD